MIKDRKLRIAIVGLGSRHHGMMEVIGWVGEADVVALCDVHPDRVEYSINKAKEWHPDVEVRGYTDYHEMFEKEDLDAVYICTNWETHARIAIDAMEHGVIPALECGGANSLEECWELVRAYERTGTHCMFLENCCYGREEMTVLNMVKAGLFGEIVHCQGGYQHDLRFEVGYGRESRHYRFNNYKHRCADIYPGHALGPIMKVLDINNGNRMISLTSTASKSVSLNRFLEKERGADYDAAKFRFNQGDVISTVIKCANGETILLTHDTSLPRPYSRGGRVQGTNGIWMEDNASIYLDGISKREDQWDAFKDYMDDPAYEHPLWTEFRADGVRGGHGGMDFLVLSAFFDCVRNGYRPPLDVYDAAALMCITPLSEASIACGSAPVAIPDFTNGRWYAKQEHCKSKYALDNVYPERYHK